MKKWKNSHLPHFGLGEKSRQVVKQLVKCSVILKDVIFDNWWDMKQKSGGWRAAMSLLIRKSKLRDSRGSRLLWRSKAGGSSAGGKGQRTSSQWSLSLRSLSRLPALCGNKYDNMTAAPRTQHPVPPRENRAEGDGTHKNKNDVLGLHVWDDRWKWGAAALWKLYLNLLKEIWLYIYSCMMNSLNTVQDYCRHKVQTLSSSCTERMESYSRIVWTYITIGFQVYDSSCFQWAQIRDFSVQASLEETCTEYWNSHPQTVCQIR